MMFGRVNNNYDAIVKVAVDRIGSPKITVDVVIDPGFTSFLSLPLSIITSYLLSLVAVGLAIVHLVGLIICDRELETTDLNLKSSK